MRGLFLTVAGAALILAPASIQAETQQGLPAQLDTSEFPGMLIDDVVVPNPGEVFWLMNKLGDPDWGSQVRKDFSVHPSTDRTDKALSFGALIADGFIAVQAENPDAVKEIGREILELAEALGLRGEVFPHTQAILEATDQREWPNVRAELDRTHVTVRRAMEQMRDDELAQCVSMAGWVRGTQVLTDLITDSYTTDKAEILNQPDLAAHFIRQVEAMNPKIASHKPVQQTLEGLRKVQAIMSSHAEGGIPSASVEKIHTICSDIMRSIMPSDR